MLASYLQFPDIDATKLYMLFGAIVIIMVAMAIFRSLGRVKETHQVQRSSWRSFEKLARVRGLSAAEAQALSEVVRRCRVKRPTQVLGSMSLFDRCLDRALERGYAGDHEQALLEAARSKLVSTANKGWNGVDRRQFERLTCDFGLGLCLVTKEALDEELRTTYQEGDAQFKRGLDTIVAQSNPLDGRARDVSAGGMAACLPATDEPRDGDYVSLTAAAEGAPIPIEGMVGRILSQEHLDEEHETLLHLGFLPYEHGVKRQIISLVHGQELPEPAAEEPADDQAPSAGEGPGAGAEESGTRRRSARRQQRPGSLTERANRNAAGERLADAPGGEEG